MLVAGNYLTEDRLKPLIQETDELIAIFVTIVTKVKARKTK